jgi:hypothetical protein
MAVVDAEVQARRSIDPLAWDELQRVSWGEDTDARWVKTEAGWVLNARPVTYGGSQTECHGPAWLIGPCDCDECAGVDPWDNNRWVLGVRRSEGEWLKIGHVRETSFQERVLEPPLAAAEDAP